MSGEGALQPSAVPHRPLPHSCLEAGAPPAACAEPGAPSPSSRDPVHHTGDTASHLTSVLFPPAGPSPLQQRMEQPLLPGRSTLFAALAPSPGVMWVALPTSQCQDSQVAFAAWLVGQFLGPVAQAGGFRAPLGGMWWPCPRESHLNVQEGMGPSGPTETVQISHPVSEASGRLTATTCTQPKKGREPEDLAVPGPAQRGVKAGPACPHCSPTTQPPTWASSMTGPCACGC